MDPEERLAAIAEAAQKIMDLAKDEGRDPTEDEAKQLEDLAEEARELKERIDRRKKSQDLVTSLAGYKAGEGTEDTEGEPRAVKGSGPAVAFVKSEAFQQFRKTHPSGVGSGTPVRIEAKGLGDLADLGIGAKAPLTTETGQFVGEQRLPGYRNELDPDAGLGFLNLITTGSTEVTYLEYARIVSETDNAAIVPEGELKPTSDLATDKADAKAYTYADGFDVTNQTLADDGALVAYMESRIRYHVQNAVIDKLINGAGGSAEPEGILNTTGVQQQAFDTDVLTTIARALEKVEAVDVDPQAIVLNPADAWNIRLLRNNNGEFYAGGPFSAAPFSPWGVPVVTTRRVAAGQALIGNFKSINFLQREALSVVAFNQHKDYAQRNMSYVRAELRGLQLFYAPREVVVTALGAGDGA